MDGGALGAADGCEDVEGYELGPDEGLLDNVGFKDG